MSQFWDLNKVLECEKGRIWANNMKSGGKLFVFNGESKRIIRLERKTGEETGD
jgi:hypothetical protein